MSGSDQRSQTIAQAIGARVRAIRKLHRITRESLALAGNSFGMTWGSTSIENIETGKAALTLPALYALCRALSTQVPGQSFTLPDLLPEDGFLELAPGVDVSVASLRSFTGDPDAVVAVGDHWGEFLQALSAPPPAPTLAEQRGAKRLGITVEELQDFTLYLWGKSLDQMLRALTKKESSPQARGHVTRSLLAEIQERIPDLRARIAADRGTDG